MPALMDSAVLLGGDVAAAAAPVAKALHPLEASVQLDTAAPTPTASGALEDWQVVTLAEIQTALAGTLKDMPDSPYSTYTGDSACEPPKPVTPTKGRKERSRKGRPKSGDQKPAAPDGDDGDVEAAPKGATKAPSSGALPGRKPAGICAWNPFAGLGPKLMGPRHKAGAHILDLAPPPKAAAVTADAPKPERAPNVATVEAGGQGHGVRPSSGAVLAEAAAQAAGGSVDDAAQTAAPGLADSAPDINAAAADAGVASSGTGAGTGDAAAPDYDTAKECGGGAGKGAATGRNKLGKGSTLADVAIGETGTTPIVVGDAKVIVIAASAAGATTPAAASNYSLPKGKAKKGKKKRAKK